MGVWCGFGVGFGVAHGVDLVWIWWGVGVGLVWVWCAFGVGLEWFWCGLDVGLVWVWCGFGLHLQRQILTLSFIISWDPLPSVSYQGCPRV